MPLSAPVTVQVVALFEPISVLPVFVLPTAVSMPVKAFTFVPEPAPAPVNVTVTAVARLA